MKKHIKRVFVLLMALLLALPAGIGASAEPTADAAPYTLVTHWDFEGDTKEEQLADKATEGKTKDALNTSGVIDINNGVADVSRTVMEYLYAEGKEGSDLYSFENKTIVMKVKLEEYVDGNGRTQFASFLGKVDVVEWAVDTKANGYLTKPYAYYVKTNGKSANTVALGTTSFTDGLLNDMGYRYYVMSFKNYVNDKDQEVMEVKQYVSTDDTPDKAKHFICLADITLVNDGESDFKTAQLENENDLIFGKRPHQLDQNRGLGEYFDDIKIYDGVLDTEALANECSNVVITDGDNKNDPKLIGAQVRNNGDSFDIRFVSEIDTLEYAKIGYKFNLERWSENSGDTVEDSYEETGFFTETTNFAYLGLNYTDAKGKTQQFYADEGKYLSVFAIEGFELTSDTDILTGTVTPFAVDKNGKEHYGTTYTVTVIDGAVKGFAAYN